MTPRRKSTPTSTINRLGTVLRQGSTRPTKLVVHKLRTTIRRVETALDRAEAKGSTRLRKQLKRIRRRAGQIRDIDVQLTLLDALHRNRDKGVVAVATELKEMREKQERRIKKSITEELDAGLIKRLRTTSAAIASDNFAANIELSAIADEFSEISRHEELTEENLHAFRTETKKLRYRAELAPLSEIRDMLISELKKVQDSIGSWHDAVTLSETAVRVLGESQRNSLISILRAQNYRRYLEAIRSVEHARQAVPGLFIATPGKKPVLSERSSESKHKSAGA
jgi:CHAD domain-containing protein